MYVVCIWYARGDTAHLHKGNSRAGQRTGVLSTFSAEHAKKSQSVTLGCRHRVSDLCRMWGVSINSNSKAEVSSLALEATNKIEKSEGEGVRKGRQFASGDDWDTAEYR